MQNSPTQSIIKALAAEEQKRDAFLNQMASIIENTLFKIQVNDNENC
ncbi:hypothetical protein [Virgibacillus salexigens]|nr:hypothetical protein [Virgibacillus massiliensis]MYL41243.1 hypothetical protein [Virgibacillus massiliensis]